MELTLASRSDIDALKDRYNRDGVVRIDNLFAPDVADAIHSVLLRGTPWHIVHSDKAGDAITYSPKEWRDVEPSARRQALSDMLGRARDGFAYFYSCYPMIDSYLAGDDPEWPLHRMTEFLNSPEMHNFVKTITGESEVRKLDAQATLYARGHFLNEHDDTGTEAERRAAYVMGFTKDWRADWGGQLIFLEDGRVIDGFSPSFNTMTIFKVPRRHIVTQVTNFAGLGRYSITGWLRVD